MSAIVSAFTATASALPAFSFAWASAQLAPLSFMSRWRSATTSLVHSFVVDWPVAVLAIASATRLPRTIVFFARPRFISPPLKLRPRLRRLLLRRRDTERRVAGAARFAAEGRDVRRHGRAVLRDGLIPQGGGTILEVLRGRFELGPLLPDLGLGLGLVGERARREKRRDSLRMEREGFGVHGHRLRRAGLHLGLDVGPVRADVLHEPLADRKSTRLNSSHLGISYAVFCLKKKNIKHK